MFDSAGDEGMRISRSTIMMNLYPETSDIDLQNKLLLIMPLTLVIVLYLKMKLQERGGIGACLVVGALFTLTAQVALLFDYSHWIYYCFPFYIGKTFGFLSTLSVGIAINMLAHPDSRGMWIGRRAALTGIGTALFPLAMAITYDSHVDVDVKGLRTLSITIALSLMALVLYIPQLWWQPRVKKSGMDPYAGKNSADLLALPDKEFAVLPLGLKMQLLEDKLLLGEAPRIVSWGSYEEQLELHEKIKGNAREDLEFLRKDAMESLHDEEACALHYERAMLRARAEQYVDVSAARNEMGHWIADYLEDAGYTDWASFPNLYKSMIMNVFPPLRSNGLTGSRTRILVSRTDWQMYMRRLFMVMDAHVQMLKRHDEHHHHYRFQFKH